MSSKKLNTSNKTTTTTTTKGLYFNDQEENLIQRAKILIQTPKALQANWSDLHESLPKAARQMWLWSLALPQHGHGADPRFSPASPHASPLLQGPTVAQGAPKPGEQATRVAGERLSGGWGVSRGELTLTLQKRKALPKLQWHPATCTHPPQDSDVSLHHLPLPTPTQHSGDTAPWGSHGALERAAKWGSTWLKGRGANPALSCPQPPCAHYGPWGASSQLTLTVTPGRHFAGEEGPRPLAPGESRTGKGGGPGQGPLRSCVQSFLPPAQPSNTCSKEHCSPNLIFSPTHTSNSPLSP